MKVMSSFVPGMGNKGEKSEDKRLEGLVKAQKALNDDSDEEELDENTGKRKKKPFVDKPWFNMVVGTFIILNALTIGLETDARSTGGNDSSLWYLAEVVFCVVFLTELVLRLYFHGLMFFQMVGRGWNCLDFCIVTISVVDTFILMPIGFGGSARFISMLRFVRLMRLVRLVRLFRIFKELWLVANGLINVLRTLIWICCLIFLICFICGIFTTRWIGHNDKVYDAYFVTSGGWDHEEYFSSVLTSVFTLLQIVTLDQWSDKIARHVIHNQPGMLIFFVLFICFTSFCLLNIIVGVVVENAIATSIKDERKMRKSKDKDRQAVFAQLRDIFEEADTDASGTLDLEEVEAAISKPEIYNKLRMIEFPVDDPRQIFVLLDYDDSGELTIEEFITGCMRMKGSAKSKDLLVAQTALNTMKAYQQIYEHEMGELTEKLKKLDKTVKSIIQHGEHVFLDMRQYRMRHPEEKSGDLPRANTGILYEAPWEQQEYVAESKSERTKSSALIALEAHNRRNWDNEDEQKPQELAIVARGKAMVNDLWKRARIQIKRMRQRSKSSPPALENGGRQGSKDSRRGSKVRGGSKERGSSKDRSEERRSASKMSQSPSIGSKQRSSSMPAIRDASKQNWDNQQLAVPGTVPGR